MSSGTGIVFEFTDDLDTQTVRSSENFTLTTSDVNNGFKNINLQPKMVGFRVRYTNGGTVQSDFLLQTDLKTNGTLEQEVFEKLSQNPFENISKTELEYVISYIFDSYRSKL